MITPILEELLLSGKARARTVSLPDNCCSISKPDNCVWVIHNVNGYAQKRENDESINALLGNVVAYISTDAGDYDIGVSVISAGSYNNDLALAQTVHNLTIDTDLFAIAQGNSLVWSFGAADISEVTNTIPNVTWNDRFNPKVVRSTLPVVFNGEDGFGNVITADRSRTLNPAFADGYSPQITQFWRSEDEIIGGFIMQIVEIPYQHCPNGLIQ